MITMEPDFELLDAVADARYGGDIFAMRRDIDTLAKIADQAIRIGSCIFLTDNPKLMQYCYAHPERMRGVIINDEDSRVSRDSMVFGSYLKRADISSESRVRTSEVIDGILCRANVTISVIEDCDGPDIIEDTSLESCEASFSGFRNVRATNVRFYHSAFDAPTDQPIVLSNTMFINNVEVPHPSFEGPLVGII